MNKLVAYYRVSTSKQESSGLGLEGQRAAVEAYAARTGARIVAEFTEVESGRKADRPELARAISHARAARGRMVIAKLDRLSRNVAFLSGLMESKAKFIACDYPDASDLTIHIMVAVAQNEAEAISLRTKAALLAYREGKHISKRTREKYPGGVPPEVVAATAGKLGGSLVRCRNLTPAARARGLARRKEVVAARVAEAAADVLPVAAGLRAGGASLRAIAAELNARGFVTRRNGPWHPTAVLRLLNRGGTP